MKRVADARLVNAERRRVLRDREWRLPVSVATAYLYCIEPLSFLWTVPTPAWDVLRLTRSTATWTDYDSGMRRPILRLLLTAAAATAFACNDLELDEVVTVQGRASMAATRFARGGGTTQVMGGAHGWR